jgi:hypothetical protein
MADPMSPDEIARLATSIRGLLDDSDSGLSGPEALFEVWSSLWITQAAMPRGAALRSTGWLGPDLETSESR